MPPFWFGVGSLSYNGQVAPREELSYPATG
jgi:hypothetical protein